MMHAVNSASAVSVVAPSIMLMWARGFGRILNDVIAVRRGVGVAC